MKLKDIKNESELQKYVTPGTHSFHDKVLFWVLIRKLTACRVVSCHLPELTSRLLPYSGAVNAQLHPTQEQVCPLLPAVQLNKIKKKQVLLRRKYTLLDYTLQLGNAVLENNSYFCRIHTTNVNTQVRGVEKCRIF